MAINSRYKLKTGEEVEYFPPIQNTGNPYLTEAAMHADQANQLEGYGYLVDGIGAFTYLGTVAGTAADYEGFGVYDDTAIQNEVDLNTAKETNIAHPLVETAVPFGAVFTDNDTIYDDTAIVNDLSNKAEWTHTHEATDISGNVPALGTTDLQSIIDDIYSKLGA